MHLPNEPAGTPSRIQDSRSWSEKRFHALLEKSSDIIALINAQGYIVYMSASLTRLTGHLPEAFLGSHILALLHREEHALMQEILAGVLLEPGKTRHMQCRICCKDGSFRWFETTLTNLLHEPVVAGIVANLHDIAGRKQLEQEREKLLQERIALLEAVDEFIRTASHELKTPVTSLKGFTQLLYRRLQRKGEEEALRFLGRMDSQLNRLTDLINDLLDVSRVQAGKLEYEDELFDLDVLVQEIVENVQATVETHKLLLENPAKASIYGDRKRIGQVLSSLLTNAIKYSPVSDRVAVRVEASESEALVCVQDFGIGIEENQQEKIFGRFYQVDNKDVLSSGLGIGLYLAQQVVERHGGRIWVESNEGEGSTFCFTLPLFKG